MLVTTTPQVEGKNNIHDQGHVTGKTTIDTNIFREMIVSMREIIGGRLRAYEQALEKRGK